MAAPRALAAAATAVIRVKAGHGRVVSGSDRTTKQVRQEGRGRLRPSGK